MSRVLSMSLRSTLSLLVALGAGEVARAAEPSPLRIETDVQERFYDVDGTNADEIFASIQRRGLGGKAGLTASGLTTSDLAYSMAASSPTSCSPAEGILSVEVVVTLPRHARPGRLDAATRRQWEAYEALVEFHEYRHVEIEFQGVQELQAKLERGEAPPADSPEACRELVERAIQDQAAITRRRHDEFHVRESRAVREARAKLLGEIEGLDGRLAEEKREIDRLEAELEALEAERTRHASLLEALVRSHGHELPPPEFAQAEETRGAIELLTDEMNELVALRNALVMPYNERVEQRRNLALRLAWTR